MIANFRIFIQTHTHIHAYIQGDSKHNGLLLHALYAYVHVLMLIGDRSCTCRLIVWGSRPTVKDLLTVNANEVDDSACAHGVPFI